MSGRVTVTRKANGRFYLGMDEADAAAVCRMLRRGLLVTPIEGALPPGRRLARAVMKLEIMLGKEGR